jgi:hypothetical protein
VGVGDGPTKISLSKLKLQSNVAEGVTVGCIDTVGVMVGVTVGVGDGPTKISLSKLKLQSMVAEGVTVAVGVIVG